APRNPTPRRPARQRGPSTTCRRTKGRPGATTTPSVARGDRRCARRARCEASLVQRAWPLARSQRNHLALTVTVGGDLVDAASFQEVGQFPDPGADPFERVRVAGRRE